VAYIKQGAAIRTANDLRDAVLGYQWLITGIAIVALTITAVVAGWWLAGRVLRPLHRITATARRLSLSTLDERIALAGPRDELKELADTFDAMLERLAAPSASSTGCSSSPRASAAWTSAVPYGSTRSPARRPSRYGVRRRRPASGYGWPPGRSPSGAMPCSSASS
jgi:HAMP domain-containing protein